MKMKEYSMYRSRQVFLDCLEVNFLLRCISFSYKMRLIGYDILFFFLFFLTFYAIRITKEKFII